MKHWSEPFVGLPWAKLGRDLAGTDCLGLARLGGAELPYFGPAVDEAEHLWRIAPSWRQVEDIREGDLLVFGHRGIEDHVGLVVSRNEMLHIEAAKENDNSESVIERFDTPKWERRRLGVYRRSHIAMARTLPPADPDAVTVVGLSFIDPSRDPLPVAVPQGETLAELVWHAYPEANERQRAALRVTIGGHVFPAESWAMVKPRAGSVVVVMPLPGFNFGALLSVIVSIAAIAAGQFYAPLLLGSLGLSFGSIAAANIAVGITQAVVTGGLLIGGNLLLSALVPPAKAKGTKDDPVFSLQGFKNEPRPDAPFPLHFGKRRQAPVIGGRSWIEIFKPSDLDGTGIGAPFGPGGGPGIEDGISSGKMYLRALFIEGIIGPTSNLVLSDFKFGDTALYKPEEDWADPDVPEFHFKNVEIETIDWFPGDAPPTLYDHQVVPTDTMGVMLAHPADEDAEPVTRVTARDAETVELIFGFPEGLIDFNSDGDAESEGVELKIERQIVGTTEWIVLEENMEIRAQSATPFWYSYIYTPPNRTQDAVRVTRLDEETTGDDDAVRSRIDWVALYAHRPESPLNGNVGLKVTAIRCQATEQLQGTIDSYNNIASRTCPDWDADTETWIVRETSNPAAAFRLAMQGPQCAFPKSDDEIDLAVIQEWSEFCEEKGLTFDYISASEDTAPELRRLIAASGRASPHHDGQKHSVLIDRPQALVHAHVTAHNVIAGSFGKSRNVQAERFPDAIRTIFYDDLNFYQRAEMIVRWPGFVGTPVVFLEMELPWIVNHENAWIETRRRQYEQIYRPRVYRCSQDWEHLKLTRFNRALLNHSVLNRAHVSSRVATITGQTVTLFDEIEMVSGESYGITFRHVPDEADETAESPPFQTMTRNVVTRPGKTRIVTLSGIGDLPEVGDQAMFGGAVDAIVKSIKRAGKLGADLTFVDYAPQIDLLTDAEVPPAWDGRVGEVITNSHAAPTDLAAEMVFNNPGGNLRGFGHFAWTAVPTRRYELQWRQVGSSTSRTLHPKTGAGDAITGSLVAANNYEGRVRESGSSEWSSWVPVPDVELLLADTEVLLEAASGILLRAS